MKTWILFLSLCSFIICKGYAQSSEAGWTVRADTVKPTNYYGVTVANGMIGLVSSSNPLHMDEIVLNGVYDYYGRGRVSNILEGFNFAGIDLDIDGQRIRRANISNFRQVLDMKHAVFSSSFDVQNKAHIIYAVRSLRQLPYTSMVDITIKAYAPIEISAASVIEAPDILRNVQNYYSEIDRPHVNIPLLTSTAQSPTGKYTIAVSNSFIFEGEDSPRIIHEDWDHNRHWARFTKKIPSGATYTFSVVASETSEAQFSDPHNEAERLSLYAKLQGHDILVQQHEKAWQKLWESDIKVEGNTDDQRDIHSALYHLYSFAREGTAYSLSPMGLSGLGYNGHVFWDTELWMFPPLLILQPRIAESLLEYRYERLPAARKKAMAHGYKGAMFPWESDDTGEEATPVWALSGPYEQHITAVVAIACWNYYQVTHDREWLEEKGYPILKEAAEFWTSRVEADRQGNYHIRNVVAADEWAENVDDNAFTNGAVIKALQFASSAATLLGKQPNPEWEKIAGKLVILKMDDGVIREHAAYNGEQIKQADVNLLAYPLGIVNDPEQVKKDLEYYEPKIGEGPAMSHSILSILYSRLGDPSKAYELFHRGYKPNEVPPFGVLAESAGGTNPYFATGAGGMLQAVLAGFGGLEITDQGVNQRKTTLPSSWKSLTITGVGEEEKMYRNGQ